ncbi:MAG: ABC transporter permease [Chitinophagaceae bacterium]|nr:ABC transporter permease [Chitinophagaceae bacterium]
MLKNYFKTAWRNIQKQRIISVINIGGLSVALTATMLISIWVYNELSFDDYHTDANRIFLMKNIWNVDKTNTWIAENSFFPLGEEIKKSIPEAEEITRMEKLRPGAYTIAVNDRIFKADSAIHVDNNWFKVFNYSFIEGGAELFYSNPQTVIITRSKAEKLFGKTAATGRQIQLNDKLFTVAGVVNDNPVNSSFQFDVITRFHDLDVISQDWLYLSYKTFIKLRPGANKIVTENKIDKLIKSKSQAQGSITSSLVPLKDMRFENDFKVSAFSHTDKNSIVAFVVLAVLLLTTASINYVNLAIARISSRIKEMSIRKITGATKRQLFFQLIAESFVTACLSLLLSIILLSLSFPILNYFSGLQFSFNSIYPGSIFMLLGTFVAVLFLTGLYPALLLSSFNPANIFKDGNGLMTRGVRFRKILVTAQFGLAIFMISATCVIYRQLNFIQQQHVTYDRSQVFTVQVPPYAFPFDKPGAEEQQESALETLKNELLTFQSVKAVSRTNITSLVNENFSISNGIDWDGKPDKFNPQYISYAVDADFNNIMHLQLSEGRWFDKNINNDKLNTVLNETAVKQFGIKEPVVGKRFKKGVIIGVVKDFYHKSLHTKIAPLVISPGGTNSENFIIQTEPGKVKEALTAVEKLWKKFFPGTYFEYSFADEEFATLYKKDTNILNFVLLSSVITILMCCSGLLGIIIFITEQKRKEIGIRKVIGATIGNILMLITKDFLKLIVISVVIAFPVTWWAAVKWLEHFAYHIRITWWLFIFSGALAIIAALITIGWQSIRAAMANPVKALRME